MPKARPNPFPGVNPFIEASGRWEGFHNSFVIRCGDQLNEHLPEHYAATVQERVALIDLADEAPTSQRKPDVTIARDLEWRGSGGTSVATDVAAEIEPATLTLPRYDHANQWYIDIVLLPDQELITSIELLSPSNKSGHDSTEYHAKRAALLQRDISLVEIDLLLRGNRLFVQEPLPPGDFYVFVSRPEERPRCQVYPWSIRRALPSIPIPLKKPDADVKLDLAAAFTMTFDRGRYDRTLRYDVDLAGPLTEPDRQWVAERLKEVSR
jgi:hypothetical protein